MKKFAPVFLLILSTQAFLACSSLFHEVVEKPKIVFDHVGVKDMSFTGATLIFALNVQNPNGVDLKIDEVTYRVLLDGKDFAASKVDKTITVPAKATIQVDVPLPVDFTKLFSGLQNLVKTQSLHYRIDGDAKLSLFTIPFSNEGKIDLQ